MRDMKRNARLGAVLAAIMVGGVAAGACGTSEADEPAMGLTTTTAEVKDITSAVAATGTVEPIRVIDVVRMGRLGGRPILNDLTVGLTGRYRWRTTFVRSREPALRALKVEGQVEVVVLPAGADVGGGAAVDVGVGVDVDVVILVIRGAHAVPEQDHEIVLAEVLVARLDGLEVGRDVGGVGQVASREDSNLIDDIRQSAASGTSPAAASSAELIASLIDAMVDIVADEPRDITAALVGWADGDAADLVGRRLNGAVVANVEIGRYVG